MDLNSWLTLVGIILSPIIAVLITLWVEGRRRDREGKMVVVRTLMATRHLPSDPNYSTAINLLRVEFADCPQVMEAYREYHRNIRRERPSSDQGVALLDQDILTSQTKLLSAVMMAVGMKVSEADLAVEAYAAGGFIARDNLYIASLAAQPRIADALERSVQQSALLLRQGEQSPKSQSSLV